MKERWKPVYGINGYEVSDKGRVRSYAKGKSRILRYGYVEGYPMVCLGRNVSRLVHRLVAEAFIGPCPRGKEVRHKDGKRHDPRLSNIHYGTRAENVQDAKDFGLWGIGVDKKRKLDDEARLAIRRLRGCGKKLKDLAKQFGVCEATVLKVIRRSHATGL